MFLAVTSNDNVNLVASQIAIEVFQVTNVIARVYAPSRADVTASRGIVSICPTLTHGGVNNYSSAFLPAVYQATPLGTSGTASDRVTVPFVKGTTPREQQRLGEVDLKRHPWSEDSPNKAEHD